MTYRRRRQYGRRRHGGGLHDLLGFIVGAAAIVGALAFVTGAPTRATESPVVVVSAPIPTIEIASDPTSSGPFEPTATLDASQVIDLRTPAPIATDDPALVQCLLDLGINPDDIDLDSIDPAEYDC